MFTLFTFYDFRMVLEVWALYFFGASVVVGSLSSALVVLIVSLYMVLAEWLHSKGYPCSVGCEYHLMQQQENNK